MKKQLFISLGLLTLVFVLFSTIVTADICVPSYIDIDGVSGTQQTLSYPQSNSCPPMHELVEGDLREDKETLERTSCCCDCSDDYEVLRFGAPSGYEHLVSTTYCTEKGFDVGVTDETNCTISCKNECDGNQQVLIEESDLYHVVSGYVFSAADSDPLANISVFALDQGDDVIVEAKTDAEGFYNLSSVPGVQNGENKFLAMTSSTHELTCEDNIENVELTEDTELNFTMSSCQQNPDYCMPDWEIGEWGECKPYFSQGFDGQYMQRRSVIDLNECDRSSGKPENWRLCEGTVVMPNCGNGELEEGEFCDPATQEGSEIFKLPDGDTVTQVTCKDILGEGYSDDELITCTDTCNYNYDSCTPVCGFYCDRKEECAMEECESLCEGEPLCGNECEGQKPVFLPVNDSVDFSTTRNIFDLYNTTVLAPDHYPGIRYFDQSTDVELTWRFNGTCEDEILAYQVVYCEENARSQECQGDTRQKIEVPKGQFQYLVEGILEPKTSYCYNVCAIQRDGSTSCAYEEGSLPCFNSGEEYCMEEHPPGYNCEEHDDGEYAPTGCLIKEFKGYGREPISFTNHSYEVAVTCEQGEVCVETEYDPLNDGGGEKLGAMCKAPLNCSTCNGMFGLYSSVPGKRITYTNDNDQEKKVSCNKFINPTPEQFSTNWAGLCYYDTSRTSFDYFDQCMKVDSCYDYKSEQACANDPCNKMDGACQWSFYSEESGIGVCKPIDEQYEECGRCDADSPLGFCNEHICENNYGNCYYREPSKNTIDQSEENILVSLLGISYQNERYDDELIPTCINKKDMACHLYQNEKDCINDSANTSIDVTYEGMTPLYGTNELMFASQDRYGFGRCAWSESEDEPDFSGCHKNSDNRYNDSLSWSGFTQGDCYSTAYSSDLRCLQDVTPPNTMLILRKPPQNQNYLGLPTYGINELANLTFSVDDDTWAADESTTYFSILSEQECPAECYDFTCNNMNDQECIRTANNCKEQGCGVYPTTLLTDMIQPAYQDKSIAHGVHKLKYFSMDPAKNIEVINSTELFIDSTAPEIYFDREEDLNISTFRLHDIYLSNVTINFKTSEQAHCHYEMTYISSSGEELTYGPDDMERVNDTFEANYRFVPDNFYNFTIVCEDEYKNRARMSIPLWVEGDVSISRAQPKWKVYNADQIEDILLSLHTLDEANCRFDPENPTYDQSRYSFAPTNQSTYHVKLFTEFVNDLAPQNVEGVYSYYTACNYTNRTLTEGLLSDMIFFSIDVTGPETQLFYLKNNDYELFHETGNDATPRASERSIKIFCDDSNGQLPGTTFGCKEIHYCYSDSSILDLTDFNPEEDCENGELLSTHGEPYFEDTLDFTTDTNKKLYFYGIDNGGNEGDLHRKNLKVIDTNFTRPIFTVI
ncbi:MAG: hypothetical protein ACQESE_01115 [Nanobdellota archaeon]